MAVPVPDAHRQRPRWQWAVLMLVGVALFLGFTSLGIWQVQRRAWKLDLMEKVSQRLKQAPSPIPPQAEWPRIQATGYEYKTVQLQGHWLQDKTVLTQATTALGAGFWVLTPLQQADATVVLVNRGFIPQNQRAQWQAPAAPEPAALVTLQGLLRMPEPGGGFLRQNNPAAQKWYSRDVAAIAFAQQLPPTAPFFVDAGIPDAGAELNVEARASDAGVWPRPGLTTVHFSNSHLVYALTWFGLACMVLGSGVLVARHERSLRHGSGHNTPHEHAQP